LKISCDRLQLETEEPIQLGITVQLNKLLGDTMTLRDLYKKSHRHVAGLTFYQLHLLFDNDSMSIIC
jgi:starvation-inducible DNA-binding protein